MNSAVYAAAYPIYRDRCWSPIKLHAGTKWPPPKGFTGHDGLHPSGADMYAWAEEEPDGNLAVRLGDTVIGIDVDDYDGKSGGKTLAEAQRRWGTLPPSPRSSSRAEDPVSGIRLYRVPAGTRLVTRLGFPELGLGGIEIIQRHHRYVVCWPSVHDKTGWLYRWYDDTNAVVLETPPTVDEIPDLPPAWLAGLREPDPVHDVFTGERIDIEACITGGGPSVKVAERLTTAIADCRGSSRHDHTRDHVLALLRYGRQAEPGVKVALVTLGKAFVAAVAGDRTGGLDEASREYRNFVYSDRVAAMLADDNTDWIRLLAERHAATNGQAPAGDTTPDVDENAFWAACAELTGCRDYARAVRVGPWAMLGVALARAAATTPPYVVLPGLVGDYASVNLYVNLVGPSGTAKSAAIGAAGAWLRTTTTVDAIKPGSGQGIAKCFAYVKIPKGGAPQQIGTRWTALAVIPEVDTLVAAGSMTGSSLWAEFRSAWSGERVGHDYTDATKTVVLAPHRYRLCMAVGVQPLRAGPLFDDVDAGTPQRFCWLPVDDPGAPQQRPEPPTPVTLLPAWTTPGYFTALEDEMHLPADRDHLIVLSIPDEAIEAIDAVAREKLRGNPGVDPLDGHRLLCQLKVAAAIMRLRSHTEITSHDWELAATVMAVSDRTRDATRAALSEAAARRDHTAAVKSGKRKLVETQMAAAAQADDIARVAAVIVTALAAADGHKLPGHKVSKAVAGRDKPLVPKALEYLEIDGRIVSEATQYRGQTGTTITLLDGEEQTS